MEEKTTSLSSLCYSGRVLTMNTSIWSEIFCQEEEDRQYARPNREQPSSFAQAVRQPAFVNQPRPIVATRQTTQSSPVRSPVNNFSDFFPMGQPSTPNHNQRHNNSNNNGWGQIHRSPQQAWPEVQNVGMPEDDDWCADPVPWEKDSRAIEESSIQNNDNQFHQQDNSYSHFSQSHDDWSYDSNPDHHNARNIQVPQNNQERNSNNHVNSTSPDTAGSSPEYSDLLAMLGVDMPNQWTVCRQLFLDA